jgi:hypothetical protein
VACWMQLVVASGWPAWLPALYFDQP